jgi:NAD(P)H-dependent FMN reductase
MNKIKIGIILGSIRPNRLAKQVGEWIIGNTIQQNIEYKILDLKEFDLPLFGTVELNQNIIDWQNAVSECHGFIVVAGEFHYSISGVLKNAIDYNYRNWARKPVLMVAYGAGANGARGAAHLADILNSLNAFVLQPAMLFSLLEDARTDVFIPRLFHYEMLNINLEKLYSWAGFLKDAPSHDDNNLYYHQVSDNKSIYLSKEMRPECLIKAPNVINIHDDFISFEEQAMLLNEPDEIILNSLNYRLQYVCKNIYGSTMQILSSTDVHGITGNTINLVDYIAEGATHLAVLTLSQYMQDYKGDKIGISKDTNFMITPYHKMLFHVSLKEFHSFMPVEIKEGLFNIIVVNLKEQ